MVVTPDDKITAGGKIQVVAISSQVPSPLPNDHVLLPWHAQGHPRTGLNRKCAAVCSWMAEISSADVQKVAGAVPATEFAEIVDRLPAKP